MLSTLVAVLWVSIVALVDAIYGGKFGLIGFLAIGPFIAAAFAGPRRTALVGLYATVYSLILSTPPRQYDQLNHFLRVLTLVASSGVATWISYLRTQRNEQLWSARSETRIERRRRVAAETAQSMQALARALTTSADPAQVADAVFGALRDELRVDAAAFATTNERGVLCVHRRFGYLEDESEGPLVAAMEPDGELAQVLGQRQGFFADSPGEQRGERPHDHGLGGGQPVQLLCRRAPGRLRSCGGRRRRAVGRPRGRSPKPTSDSSSPSPERRPRPSSEPA